MYTPLDLEARRLFVSAALTTHAVRRIEGRVDAESNAKDLLTLARRLGEETVFPSSAGTVSVSTRPIPVLRQDQRSSSSASVSCSPVPPSPLTRGCRSVWPLPPSSPAASRRYRWHRSRLVSPTGGARWPIRSEFGWITLPPPTVWRSGRRAANGRSAQAKGARRGARSGPRRP